MDTKIITNKYATVTIEYESKGDDVFLIQQGLMEALSQFNDEQPCKEITPNERNESMFQKLSTIVKQFLLDHSNGVTPAEMLALSRTIEAVYKGAPECDFGDAYGQINDGFEKCINNPPEA
jgi:hypothetical protein